MHPISRKGFLFLIACLLPAVVCLYLIVTRSIPAHGDTFQYFTIQYVFLNNVVFGGGIPQWMPFMTHGTLVNTTLFPQGSILQYVLLYTGGLFKHINFNILFHLGILCEQLLLITGLWQLSRRWFSRASVCFLICVLAAGSVVWTNSIFLNFHFYYAIPLVLALLHQFLESGKVRYYFLAGNLLAFQTLAASVYFIPVTTFVIFLYTVLFFLFYPENFPRLKRSAWSLNFLFVTAVLAVFFGLVFYSGRIGMDQLALYSSGRQADGTVPLESFLYYGTETNLIAWLEVITGITPLLAYNLYFGILSAPLLLTALLVPRKKYFLFMILSAVLFLTGMGTLLSVFFYFAWPLMKFYRHLSGLFVFVKLFLCFAAGCGFETLIDSFSASREKHAFPHKLALWLPAGLLLGIGIFNFWEIGREEGFISYWLDHFFTHAPNTLPAFSQFLTVPVVSFALRRTGFFALASAALIAAGSFKNLKGFRALWTGALLFLAALDIYSYHFLVLQNQTRPLNGKQYSLLQFQTVPYAEKRELFFWENNLRAMILFPDELKNAFPHIQAMAHPLDEKGLVDNFYFVLLWPFEDGFSTDYSFFFKDQLVSSLRTDYWMKPLDQMMRTFWQQPLDGREFLGKIETPKRMLFPVSNTAALRIAGQDADKIQFFSGAYGISSPAEMSELMKDPSYTGDSIFVDAQPGGNIASWAPGKSPAQEDRIELPYKVTRFDNNHLNVEVTVPDRDSAWMLYSDVWYTAWKAAVDDVPAPVYKTNLAYKSVRLHKGLNRVRFYIEDARMVWFHRLFGLDAAFWLIFLFFTMTRLARGNDALHD